MHISDAQCGHDLRLCPRLDRRPRPHQPVAQLKAAGCETIFREKITGATAERPQLKKLMAHARPRRRGGDPAVDRLSRDTTDLLVIARDMQRAGAGLRSLAEPVVDTTSDFAELVLAMLGVAAKLERRRIIERTARGRADAKAKGVKFGRKPILTPHQQQEARKRIEAGETQRSVARSYNVSQATISMNGHRSLSLRRTSERNSLPIRWNSKIFSFDGFRSSREMKVNQTAGAPTKFRQGDIRAAARLPANGRSYQ